MGVKYRKAKTSFDKYIGIWKKYNYQFVDYVVTVASTPLAFWCAVCLIILPEIWPSTLLTVQFVSGTVIQLLFLFLILIAQSRTEKKNAAKELKDREREIKDHSNIELIHKRLDVIETKLK